MIYEGVNFNVAEVEKMNREEFIARHLKILWLNREKETRKKMLGKVYDLITKPKEEKTTK